MFGRIFTFILFGALFLSGCAHRDEELSTNPTTNNPHLIIDSNRSSGLSGFDY